MAVGPGWLSRGLARKKAVVVTLANRAGLRIELLPACPPERGLLAAWDASLAAASPVFRLWRVASTEGPRSRGRESQPELGADRVSLRPPICPKGGPMDFLDIPGHNIAQEPGGKGWNPANGVPFCARAYICRPSPLGLAGWLCDAGEYVGRP